VSGDYIDRLQFAHERADEPPRQGRVVHDTGDLARRRQQPGPLAAPARRVLAVAPPCTLLAVSVLLRQSGSTTFKTVAVSIAATETFPSL
jgi:hypothetical protein